MPRYIDAEQIEKFITDGLNNTENPMGNDAIKILTEIAYAHTISVVDGMPVKIGHWIKFEDIPGYVSSRQQCSCCKEMYDNKSHKDPKYCPNCGAEMSVEVEYK